MPWSVRLRPRSTRRARGSTETSRGICCGPSTRRQPASRSNRICGRGFDGSEPDFAPDDVRIGPPWHLHGKKSPGVGAGLGMSSAPQSSRVLVEGGIDAGVPWHFGDPMREQRLLATGQGVVDLSHRGVIAVTGPDRLSWLHSLTTQQLETLPPGIGVTTLI